MYEKAITLNSPAANPLRIVAAVQSRVALTGPGMLMRLPHLEVMGPRSQRHPALAGVEPEQHWTNAAWHVRGRCTVPDKPPRITAGMMVSYHATHESVIDLFFLPKTIYRPSQLTASRRYFPLNNMVSYLQGVMSSRLCGGHYLKAVPVEWHSCNCTAFSGWVEVLFNSTTPPKNK